MIANIILIQGIMITLVKVVCIKIPFFYNSSIKQQEKTSLKLLNELNKIY